MDRLSLFSLLSQPKLPACHSGAALGRKLPWYDEFAVSLDGLTMGLVSIVKGFYYERKKRKTHERIKELSLHKISQWVDSGNPIRLDIGAGEKSKKLGWFTLDRNSSCDLCWDLTDGMPFPDSTITAIYSSHLFEHIPIEGLTVLLRECYRSLRIGGSISVCVPDARPYFEAYVNGQRCVEHSSPAVWQPGWHETGSLIDQINYLAYMKGEHRFMFDEDNLLRLLEQTGFSGVTLRSFDPEIDLPDRNSGSIYAIGFKTVA